MNCINICTQLSVRTMTNFRAILASAFWLYVIKQVPFSTCTVGWSVSRCGFEPFHGSESGRMQLDETYHIHSLGLPSLLEELTSSSHHDLHHQFEHRQKNLLIYFLSSASMYGCTCISVFGHICILMERNG